MIGTYSEEWDGWVVLDFEREGGRWLLKASAYGEQPRPTPEEKGRGLHLAWASGDYVVTLGEHPQATVLLINGRSEVWKDDRGEYVALGDIFDLVTRQSLPRSPGWAWAGVGRTYVLAPGESASLRVGFHHMSRSTNSPPVSTAFEPTSRN